LKDLLIQKLETLKMEAKDVFVQASNLDDLYQKKLIFLGKKGRLTEVLKELGQLSVQDRPVLGALANQLKVELESLYSNIQENINKNNINEGLQKDHIDTSLPGFRLPHGHAHPVNLVLDEMKDIFSRMGFDLAHGPEIETDYYNFEALNIPQNHPARDMQDTFYVDGSKVLRTHTSPVQIRVMEKTPPPIQIVAPGVVYRRDSDMTHTPMFHQIEGLLVDENVTLSHLKGVVETFLRLIFESKVKVRFRPSFFPFTEPSSEVDIGCVFCKGDGCRVCKNTGWLEIMGCGMVDPAVFKFVKIDPEKYTGFAFGVGIERITMLKYGINDIRLFFENDLRFLKQF